MKEIDTLRFENKAYAGRLPFSRMLPMPIEKYSGETIRWLDCGSHYELIFTDDFVSPGSVNLQTPWNAQMPFRQPGSRALLTDIIQDMRHGDKKKPVHVFVSSFGGEVAALCMILQQLLLYEKRVGINLGTACSCGWMLLFACPVRYVSPFSQAMYHDIAATAGGKYSELRRNAEFMAEWQEELLQVTDTAKVLTPEELELGKTSEVWFTGRKLIERGAAFDYCDYDGEENNRNEPIGEIEVNGRRYRAVHEDIPGINLPPPAESCRPFTEDDDANGVW